MIAFETEAVLENNRTLRLQSPVHSNHPEVVRVILLLEEASKPAPEWPKLFFETHYGSCESDLLDDAKELAYETNRLPLE